MNTKANAFLGDLILWEELVMLYVYKYGLDPLLLEILSVLEICGHYCDTNEHQKIHFPFIC